MRSLRFGLFLFLCLTSLIESAGSQTIDGLLREWNTSPLRPYDIEVLSVGSVWMSITQNSLFTINPQTGVTTSFTAPFGPAQFQTIARSTDNTTLWVADSLDRIVHFNPAGGTFTAYPLPAATFTLPASPFGVSVAGDGSVWFTCWTDR